MKHVNLVNIFGMILVPILILFKGNPYVVTVICATISAAIFLKHNRGYINGIFSWNMGFMVIIGLDGLFFFEKIGQQVGFVYADISAFLICYSFLIINLSYVHFYQKKIRNTLTIVKPKISIQHKQTKINLLIIIGLYLLVLALKIQGSIDAFLSGRAAVSESEFGGVEEKVGTAQTILRYIVKYTTFILPAIIYHYIYTKTKKSNLLLSLLILFPIFFIQFASGVRYLLLFTLGTFLVTYTYYNRKPIKHFSLFLGALFLVYIGGTFISKVRSDGLSTLFDQELNVSETYDRTEHTMQFMTMVVDYYSDRSYEYGTSSASLFLFWIPRSIWEDKPPLMGYWFIREYYGHTFNFGPTYSAPASYISEAYSDFGPFGMLFLSILMGYLFALLDIKLKDTSNMFSLRKLVFFFAVAALFFLPRQINQSYMGIIGVALLIGLMIYFAKEEKIKIV